MRQDSLPRSKFVVAFNRDRDFYELPVALRKCNLLSRLVTDLYLPDIWPRSRRPKTLKHRSNSELPSRFVVSAYRAAILQLAQSRLGVRTPHIWPLVDSLLSRAAADEAYNSGAHLLLYSRYAAEAFSDRRLSSCLKGLFVFHPHHALSRQVLEADLERYPKCRISFEREIGTAVTRNREDTELRLASFMLCASSFTKKSLLHFGVPKERIVVVPYASRPFHEVLEPEWRDSRECQFLFVGQGIQRKGLHHLLKAWSLLRLPNAKLTVVCSYLDPGIAIPVPQNVRILPGLPRKDLDALYGRSHVFVMPSLVEGFGLVYLDALSAGCFTIGSRNSGLLDLNLTEESAIAIEPGGIAQLSAALELAYKKRQENSIDHQGIIRDSGRYKIDQYRALILKAIKKLCPELFL